MLDQEHGSSCSALPLSRLSCGVSLMCSSLSYRFKKCDLASSAEKLKLQKETKNQSKTYVTPTALDSATALVKERPPNSGKMKTEYADHQLRTS